MNVQVVFEWIEESLLTAPGFWLITFFAICGTYVHFRGKRKQGFFRQLFDHSTFMAPVNMLMYLFSKAPNTPYLSLNTVPELQMIQDNWEVLRDEALALENANKIKSSTKYNDAGFNSFFRRGWKRFYIKWYGDYHQSAVDICPKTIEIIDKIPAIKAAMFVVLPADSFLYAHRDPFAGSLRYHLGLITPNHEKCFIDVDGERYVWKDGEHVLFDETYVHHAENKTEKDRLIFFCDIKRPMRNRVGDWLNSFFSWFILAAAASPNEEGDKTGNINKVYGYIYQIRLVGKRLKQYNKVLYQFVKYALFGGLIYLIFF
ncbi:MAG: aspartyl/asparaginyl beta-hydroxylase domain-containing protein [Bacteroidota bacterium]